MLPMALPISARRRSPGEIESGAALAAWEMDDIQNLTLACRKLLAGMFDRFLLQISIFRHN
jgi:hypothetical protein